MDRRRDSKIIEGLCEPRFEQVREAFARGFEPGDEQGAAVAITLDGRPVVDLWGGSADASGARPWQRDTLVNVFSTTKGITALCALRLIDAGALTLETRVAELWPEFAADGKRRVTVRELLNHQAGLPAVSAPLPRGALYDWGAMTAALAAQSPWWEPGTRHGYHAITFGYLLGEVIRRVTGRTVGAYFREEVAEPLDVDFHIGLAPEQAARAAELIPSPIAPATAPTARPGEESPLAAFMRDLRDPTTLPGAAFNNPKLKGSDYNSREWRAAEIPAANGHGTARALARVYGALACGGELSGVTLLRPEMLARATQQESFGPDAVLGGLPMRFGLGFMLRHDFMPLGPNPGAFGHPGAGGSVAFADPERRIGFAYVMNRMRPGMLGGPGAFALIRALYR